jgi:hypothetical protein
MENANFTKLVEIANWQLKSAFSNVDLPELQRGFVWKNSQIESLWDSLLRGFPIGSFLLSKSETDKFFLLDGQQRATSIALGYYAPWLENIETSKFWSLKKIPTIWIDIFPKETTATQKFVIRAITQSHPWGYQCQNNTTILSIADRHNALEIFKQNPQNSNIGYTKFSSKNTFPFDTNLPVPLVFLINALKTKNWKDNLITLCKENLPCDYIKTKKMVETEKKKGEYKKYIEILSEVVGADKVSDLLVDSIKNLNNIEIPCSIVPKSVLEAEDEQSGEDPTLFVRLNSQGTRIEGEELIYSIYKASFPNSKKLVENVGCGFISPSKVINMVSRMAWSEMEKGAYPYPMNVNEFRKRIHSKRFVQHLNKMIGDENNSPVSNLFTKAIEIFLSKGDIDLPPVLVKYIISNSIELFLMLLQWLKLHDKQELDKTERTKIIASFTALSWFSRDNTKYVREIWENIVSDNFWSKKTIRLPFFKKDDYIMYPLVQPNILRKFLLDEVVIKAVTWNNLYTHKDDIISEQYKRILSKNIKKSEITDYINDIWSNFIDKLVDNKAVVLFAQRKYINDNFDDFNQIETLEDTNTPWDWDHIYPSSWVYGKHRVDDNVRNWTYRIGNLRALSLEDNRSESNILSPKERLSNELIRKSSFIKNEWDYWKKITDRIYDDKNDIKNYLNAIINRSCNIYEEWYNVLHIGELFDI